MKSPGSSSYRVAPRPGRSPARGSRFETAPPPDQSSSAGSQTSLQMLLSVMRRPYDIIPPSFVMYRDGVRASRLISLLLLLQMRGQLTATELADHFEVSVRNIHRDVEA